MKITVVLEKASMNWCAYSPDLADCVIATGATRDEVIESFQSALQLTLSVREEDAMEMPDITELIIQESIPFVYVPQPISLAA